MKRLLLVFLVGLYTTTAWAQNPAAVNLKQQGDDLVKTGNLRAAVRAYRQAMSIDPTYMDAYGGLSTVYLKAKKYKRAVKLLRKAIGKDHKYPTAWYNMAYALRKLKRLDGAIKAYKAFARLKPQSADAYFGLGLAYKQKGDLKAAAGAFRTYARLEKRAGRKAWVAKALAQAKALEEKAAPAPAPAPAPVAAPVAAPPAAPAGNGRARARRLKARGDALVKAGRLNEAVSMYKGAIASDKSYTPAYSELGTTLFGLSRFADAIKPFRLALRDNPKYYQGWYNLAYALRKSKRYGEAIGAYRRYIQARPSESDPYFGLGLAYQALSNKKMAVWAFKTYVAKEKRPGQARWVQKARTEIARLESATAAPVAAAPAAPPDTGTTTRKGDLVAMSGNAKKAKPASSVLPWRRKARRPARAKPRKKLGKLLPVVTPAPAVVAGPPTPKAPAKGDTSETAVADKLVLHGKYKAAYKKYVRVVKADPFQVKAFDGLVFCAYKLKAYRQGVGAMKMATRDNPGYVRGWLFRGRLERSWGKPVDAAGSYRRYLRKKPGDLDVHLELARTLKQAKMKGASMAAYTHYLKKERRKEAAPGIMAAHMELSALGGKPPATRIWLKGDRRPMTVAVYLKRKEAEKKAAAEAAAAAAAAPPVKATPVKGPAPVVVPTRVAAKPAKPASDAEGLAKAVTGDMTTAPPRVASPDSPGDVVKGAQAAARNLTKMGDQAFSKRHYAVALGLYHQASKLDPTNTEALYKAGVAAMSLGQMRRASRLFGMVLKLDPKNKAAQINLKLTYAAAGKSKASGEQEKVVRATLRKRRYAAAERQASKALQTAATARLYHLRAVARLQQRKARGALNDGGRALALNPGLVDAIKLMGDAHRYLKNKKQALYYYKLYLAKTASDVRQARGRAWVQRVVKRLSR